MPSPANWKSVCCAGAPPSTPREVKSDRERRRPANDPDIAYLTRHRRRPCAGRQQPVDGPAESQDRPGDLVAQFPAGLVGSCARQLQGLGSRPRMGGDRSEEHTSELQSLMRISYAVFCLKKKNKNHKYIQP